MTHETIRINGPATFNACYMYTLLHIRFVGIAVTVEVPTDPWMKNERSRTEVHLLDLLYHACNLVKHRRDRILNYIMRKRRFEEKFILEPAITGLTITFRDLNLRHRLEHN